MMRKLHRYIAQQRRYPLLLSVALCATMGLAGCSGPDTQDLQAFIIATKQASPGKKFEALPTLPEYKPFPYTAEGLKDPFALSVFVVDALKRAEPVVVDNGVRPDVNRPREELEKYTLGSLRMVGTFRSPDSPDLLWALVKAPDGIVHKVRKGNHMGENFGEIYNIADDRVDLQEVIADGNNGWKERQSFLSLNQR